MDLLGVSRPPKRWPAYGFGCTASLALVFCLSHLSGHFPKTSDQINYLRAGLAVLGGDWRLRGWVLSAPDFYTSDIWLTVLLAGMLRLLGRGAHPIELLLSLQPAISWAAAVCSAVVLADAARWPRRIGAVLIVLGVFGVPLMQMPAAQYSLFSAIHVGSVVYSLWILWAGARVARRGGEVLLFCLTVLAVFGDPLVLVTAVLPVCLLPLLTQGRWRGTAIVLAGAICAKALLAFNAATGGFACENLIFGFARFEDLGWNASVCLHALLQLGGSDFFGRSIAAAAAPLLHVPLATLALATLVAAGRFLADGRRTPASLDQLLVLGCWCDILAILLSDRVAWEGGGIAIGRYLFPAWVFMGVLLARCCAHRRLPVIAAIVALASALAVDAPMAATPADLVDPPGREMVAWLEQHAPHQGIASYFTAAMFELASGGKLHIVPGLAYPAGTVLPLIQITPPFDFSAIRRDGFFVLIPTQLPTFNQAQAIGTFGQPLSMRHVLGYLVLIYGAEQAASR